MTTEELKSITDRLDQIHGCYQAISHVMNEHDPYTALIANLNDQFRAVLDQLDELGVMS